MIWLYRNVGCSRFVAAILLTVSSSQGSGLSFESGCESWRVVSLPLVPMGLFFCWEYLLPVQDRNLTRSSKGFLFYFSSFLSSSVVKHWPDWKLVFRAGQEMCLGLLPKVNETMDPKRKNNILEPLYKDLLEHSKDT